MGNRALICTQKKDLAVYLHWNGGRDSVEAFLKYCKLQGYRPPEQDSYGWARLCQVICNFMGGDLSVGIDLYANSPFMNDNGTYIIENWEIVDREEFSGLEQRNHDLREMLDAINKSMPEADRLDLDKVMEVK